MTAASLARTVLARVARPRTLAPWACGIVGGLGGWALLTLWWNQDLDAVGLGLVAAMLVVGLAGSVSVLLASDVLRLALVAGATRRRVLAAWTLLTAPLVVPIVAVVVAGVSGVGASLGWIPSGLVPLLIVATTTWFGGLGLLCALASPRRRVRRTAAPGLLLLALASAVGAGATAFDPVPGWAILAVALILTVAVAVRLALGTSVPPDLAGLLARTPTTRRKVAR